MASGEVQPKSGLRLIKDSDVITAADQNAQIAAIERNSANVGLLQGGAHTFSVMAVNVNQQSTIIFPTAYSSVPVVLLIPVTTQPLNYTLSISDVSQSSAKININAKVIGNITIYWFACTRS